jgi:uncharacterized cupredoxin-like copper-binding protein
MPIPEPKGRPRRASGDEAFPSFIPRARVSRPAHSWRYRLGVERRRQSAMLSSVVSRILVPLASTVGLVACGDDETTTSPAATSGPATVAVTLEEFAVGTVPASAAAGSITFNATNNGPDDDHEFVVISTDLPATELPTKPDGSVDEDGEGITVIDEIEEFPPGTTESLTVDLEAGPYVFICNIYDKTEKEAHYKEGMRTSFTVT